MAATVHTRAHTNPYLKHPPSRARAHLEKGHGLNLNDADSSTRMERIFNNVRRTSPSASFASIKEVASPGEGVGFGARAGGGLGGAACSDTSNSDVDSDSDVNSDVELDDKTLTARRVGSSTGRDRSE